MIKHVIFILILTMSLSALAMPAGATTYYVATNGKDTNTGSSNNPFRTIQKGVDTAKPGDTVRVNAGTYYERVSLSTDGTIGNPITIEGENGTIVDGSDAVNANNWVTAPEIGTGVYKQTSYAYAARSMYVINNGTPVDISECQGSDCLSGSTYMATATDATVDTRYSNTTVNWWDGIEALFAFSGSTLYVRFGDNSNPGSKTIRTAPTGSRVFDLSNDSYITLKNLEIRGAYQGVYLSGSSCNNIVIDNCKVYAIGRQRIYILGGAGSIEIKNSEVYGSANWDLGSYKPGTFYGSPTYAQAISEWIYDAHKFRISPTTSSKSDMGIQIDSHSSGISIHDNEIYDSLEGIAIQGNGEVSIYNNTIYNMSSIGIAPSIDSQTVIYNNLIYNCDKLLRYQSLEQESNRYSYVFNNRFYQPGNDGSHISFKANGTPSPHPDLWFYHNSFAGGYRIINDGMTDYGGIPEARFVNNIFSPGNRLYYGSSTHWDKADFVEFFDYNWMGGDFSGYSGDAAWMLENNIDAERATVWDNSSLPDFVLSDGHAARNAGIDVSTNFTINGKIYQPLPGMKTGYYANDKPDLGVDFPNPPKNFRSVLN